MTDAATDTSALDGLSLTQLNALSNQAGTSNGNVYTAAINAIESHGSGDTSTITNPSSGARGGMQVTSKGAGSKSPGFGVQPSDGTPEDDARAGRDYFNALNNHFGDPNLAAIAYNWGPGNTNLWLKSGADINKLPAETLNYVNKFDDHVKAMTGAAGGDQGAPPPQAQPQPQQAAPAQSAAPQAPAAPAWGGQVITPISTGQPTYTATPAPQKEPGSDVNPLQAMAAGAKESVQKLGYGAEKMIGQGAQFLEPDNPDAQRYVSQGEQGIQQADTEAEQAGGHTGWGKAAGFATDVVPYVAADLLAPEIAIPAQMGLGAAQATGAGGNPLLGAALGGGGPILAKAAGPIIAKGAQALGGAATGAAKGVGGALNLGNGSTIASQGIYKALVDNGENIPNVINNLRTNAIAPTGVARSAEEAASNSPTLAALTEAASKTPEGQGVRQAGDLANTDTRITHLESAVDPTVATDAANFRASQDALLQQSKNELPGFDQAASDAMQGRPIMTKAINDASKEGANTFGPANNPFQLTEDAVHADAANRLENLTGTQADLDAARVARTAQANADYGQVSGYVDHTAPGFADLVARPHFLDAFEQAAKNDASRFGLGGPPALIPGMPPWIPQRISISTLQGAKALLEDATSRAYQSGNFIQGSALKEAKGALDAFLKGNSRAYSKANANFAAASAPIDRMSALQSRLIGAVDPQTGQVLPNRLIAAINSVLKEQAKSGIRMADRVSPQDLQTLVDIAKQAAGAKTNIGNLNAEGQHLLWNQLKTQATSKANDLQHPVHAALNDLEQEMAKNSPSFAQHLQQALTTGQNIATRESEQGVLQQALTNIKNHVANGGELNARVATTHLGSLPQMQSPVGNVAREFLGDLRNKAAVDPAGIKAGIPTYGGIMGHVVGHGATTASAVGNVLHGNLGKAAATFMGQHVMGKGQAAVNQGMVDWLGHGGANGLADELERLHAGRP